MAEMWVDAGELKHRIRIVRRNTKRDKDGYQTKREASEDYETVRSCKASFKQLSGTEAIKANSDFAEEKVRFLVRWSPKTIERKMIVLFRGKEYEIEYAHDYGGGRKWVEIWAVWRSQKEGADHDDQ
ncbi:MAG: phage head closure protein [Oscillibacter sp.]|nr:phage head closure protein [Oscillibacter sp.]